MTDPIATMHTYAVGLTADLNEEQQSDLAEMLRDFAMDVAPGRFHSGVVLSKTGANPVYDFTPATFSALGLTDEAPA